MLLPRPVHTQRRERVSRTQDTQPGQICSHMICLLPGKAALEQGTLGDTPHQTPGHARLLGTTRVVKSPGLQHWGDALDLQGQGERN